MLEFERKLYKDGVNLIAGVDEVGRGPLYGPVVTAAVILPKNYFLEGLTDSKKLSEKKRNIFYDIICHAAIKHSLYLIMKYLEIVADMKTMAAKGH